MPLLVSTLTGHAQIWRCHALGERGVARSLESCAGRFARIRCSNSR
jgi:hypothetical protein